VIKTDGSGVRALAAAKGSKANAAADGCDWPKAVELAIQGKYSEAKDLSGEEMNNNNNNNGSRRRNIDRASEQKNTW
jgi:hypothetical protein